MRLRSIATIVTTLGLSAAVGVSAPLPVAAGGAADTCIPVCAVTSTADSGPGSYRAAVIEANADENPPTIIQFDPGLTIDLAGAGPTYSGILGLIIEGNGSRIDGNDNTILESTSSATITVNDLELDDGFNGAVGGAFRLISGSLRLDRVTITSSSAPNGGGAIAAFSGGASVIIEDSELLANSSNGPGGAVAVPNGSIEVRRSRFAGNDSAGVGGAIVAGDVLIVGSTFNGNSNSNVSGGGAVYGQGHLRAFNSTFVDNEASAGSGGALRTPSTPLTVRHSTFSGNAAPTGAHLATNGSATLFGTVFTDPLGGGDNCGVPTNAVTAQVYSTDATCSTAVDGTGDVTGGDDPALGPLRDNGAGLYTLYPLWGSPLVDHIGPGDCDPTADPDLAVDQRGVARPFEAGCDVGAVEQAYPNHAFTDSAAWVEGAIRWITSPVNAAEPIMTGITPTTFEPNDDITRAQVTRLLYREAGSPSTGSYPPHGFTDVPAWVDAAVTWAKAENIMTGITATRFAPNDPITRAQVVRAKYRLAGEPDISALPAHPFTDVPAWVTDAVRWAAANSLVTGITPTRFRPNDPITRGQVARMDYRLAINPDAWDDPDTAPLTLPFRPVP